MALGASARRVRAGLLASFVLLAALASLVFAAAPQRAAAATYVGNQLSEVKAEDWVKIEHPQPVQILFTFKTKGAPNARATKFLKDQVIDDVKKTGLFSDVSENPVPNGAILNITIDNVMAPGAGSEAAAKGAVTGATLFIVGNNVTDHYICTIEYVSGPNATKITRTANHSVITQLGMINATPKDAVKVGGMKDAIFVMTREIIDNPLNDAAHDPAFLGAPPATVAAVVAPPGPADAAPPAAATAPATAPAPASAPAPAGAAPTPAPAATPTTPQ